MSSLTDNEKNGLKSKKYLDFLTCLNQITNKLKRRDYIFSEFGESLRVIFDSDLEVNEKCRRASIFISKTLLLIDKEKFVEIISSLPTEIKSGISQSIPEGYLPFIFENKTKKENQEPRLLPQIKKEDITNSETATESKDTAVILLSTIENQNSNISLLRDKGFSVSRIVSDEDLYTQLSSGDICGFVIDGSFWLEKEQNQQDEILKKVIDYSTIACLFIDRTNFHAPEQLLKKVEDLCPRDIESNRLQIRDKSSLSSADIPSFELASELLSKRITTKFLFYDLSDIETTVLISSANAFLRKECNDQTKTLDLLRIKTVSGGRSCEKIVAIYFDSDTMPCIAKIGKRDSIMNEYNRFREFINIRDNQLKPYVHFHSGIGIIIWGSICDPTSPTELAPTLEGQISGACCEEVWGTDNEMIIQKCENLKKVIHSAINKLIILNNKPNTSNKNFESFAYLRGSSLKELEKKGINFNLPLACGEEKISTLIETAHKVLEPHNNKAIVHGDINLRNILVRDIESYVIDYDTTGPGHPAYDLVRLECSLVFQFLRALGTEDEFVELQKSISVNFENFENLKQKHPIWFSSSVNNTILEAVINCRDKCVENLQKFDLDKKDYIATKFIISCYSVALPQLQMGFVRGSIRALAAEFG